MYYYIVAQEFLMRVYLTTVLPYANFRALCIVVSCVCVHLLVFVCVHEIVHAMTHHSFKLESRNFDKNAEHFD